MSDSSSKKMVTKVTGNSDSVAKSSNVVRKVYSDEKTATVASWMSTYTGKGSVAEGLGECSPRMQRGKRCKEEVTKSLFDSDSDASHSHKNVLAELRVSFKRREAAYKRTILQNEFELKHLQAIVRSYRNKAKKMRSIAMAGIAREDMVWELAEYKIEVGKVTNDTVKSDDEDENERNKLYYSYIDNELFNTEN